MGHIWPAACFWMSWELRMVFTFTNGWNRIKRKMMFYDVWKLYEIKMWVAIVQFYWNTATSFSYALSVTAFAFRWQSRVVGTGTVWSANLRIFILWTIRKKVYWPLVLMMWCYAFCPWIFFPLLTTDYNSSFRSQLYCHLLTKALTLK